MPPTPVHVNCNGINGIPVDAEPDPSASRALTIDTAEFDCGNNGSIVDAPGATDAEPTQLTLPFVKALQKKACSLTSSAAGNGRLNR